MRNVMLQHPAEVTGLFRVDSVQGRRACVSSARRLGVNWVQLAAQEPADGHGGDLVQPGDVVRLTEGQRRLTVCWRTSDRHHTLFVTNQCNSRCLMCSQPPTPQADGWLFDEALAILDLVQLEPAVVGITGGEPTLHAHRLRGLLDAIHGRWSTTQIEVLTNARLLADEGTASGLISGLTAKRVNWLVPLYGASDEVHDYVVQAPGAFDETVAGLLHLQQYEQRVQLRTVLVRPVIDRLAEWASFVGRNLPFVDAVALMATEPVGYALANLDLSVVDVSECSAQLIAAIDTLRSFGLAPVLMNMPLCKLPESLRPFAAQSISDWKNNYAPECGNCALRPQCAGFFVWDKTAVYRAGLQPVPVRAGDVHV